MESLPGSTVRPPNKDITKTTFCREFWNDYCRITHFHGFHEMKTSNDWFNKMFWIAIIIFGFGFSVGLISIGVINILSDPVDTHVTFISKGDLDLPVLYCPKHWIDMTKINGTEKYLLYALSYLEIPNHAYIPYEKMNLPILDSGYDNGRDEDDDFDEFDEVKQLTRLASFQIAIYLSDKSIPSFYNSTSRRLVSSIPNLFYMLICSPHKKKLINSIYPLYLENRSEQLFSYIYYNLTFTYDIIEFLKNNFQQSSIETTNFTKDRCSTLNNLENILKSGVSIKKLNSNMFRTCAKMRANYETKNVNEVSAITIYIQETFIRLFNGSVFTKIICHENTNDYEFELFQHYQYCSLNEAEQKMRIELEQYRSKRMIELISEDERIKRNNHLTNEEAIRNYFKNCCFDNVTKLGKEIKSFLSKELQFLDEEKVEFDNFLKSKKFHSPLDFLKSISIDESDLSVSFSMDKEKHIRPNSSKITTKRVVTTDGTCILIRIQLSANSVGRLVDNTDENDDAELEFQHSERYPGEPSSFDIYNLSPAATVYVNIVVMQTYNSSFFQRESSSVSFSESAYSKSQNSFDPLKFVLSSKIFPAHDDTRNLELELYYDHFAIDSVRKINSIDRSTAPCLERELNFYDANDGALPYSYSNCRFSCSDPKTVHTRNLDDWFCRIIPCPFLAQNFNEEKCTDDCSLFNLHQIYKSFLYLKEDRLTLNTSSSNKQKCFNECTPPCKMQTIHIQKGESLKDNTAKEKSYIWWDKVINNTSIRNEILWMPTSYKTDIFNYVNYRYSVKSMHLDAGQSLNYERFELVISTEVTTYEEQLSFTWDQLFGVVGGQIGLVMGASCLTLIQFLWLLGLWIFRYLSGKLQSIKLYKFDDH